jgi:hypothetical protein
MVAEAAAADFATLQLIAEATWHAQVAVKRKQARHARLDRVAPFQPARGHQAVHQGILHPRAHPGRFDVRDRFAEMGDAEASSEAGASLVQACHTESAAADGKPQGLPLALAQSKNVSRPSVAQAKKKASWGMPLNSKHAVRFQYGHKAAGTSAIACQ